MHFMKRTWESLALWGFMSPETLRQEKGVGTVASPLPGWSSAWLSRAPALSGARQPLRTSLRSGGAACSRAESAKGGRNSGLYCKSSWDLEGLGFPWPTLFLGFKGGCTHGTQLWADLEILSH